MEDTPVEQTNTNTTISMPQASVAPTVTKSFLPWSLTILGVTALIYPIILIMMIVPKFTELIANMGGGPYGFLFFLPGSGLIGVFIANIFYGVHLVNKQKKQGGLNAIQKRWGVLLLIAGIIAGVLTIPVLLYSMITPIYGVIEKM